MRVRIFIVAAGMPITLGGALERHDQLPRRFFGLSVLIASGLGWDLVGVTRVEGVEQTLAFHPTPSTCMHTQHGRCGCEGSWHAQVRTDGGLKTAARPLSFPRLLGRLGYLR
jgi:hypothetical protein